VAFKNSTVNVNSLTGPIWGHYFDISHHSDECVCVFTCGCSLICVDFSLQADSIYKHSSHVGRPNEKKGVCH